MRQSEYLRRVRLDLQQHRDEKALEHFLGKMLEERELDPAPYLEARAEAQEIFNTWVRSARPAITGVTT